MRAHEFTNTGIEEGLEVDVPNEDWLQDKIDYAQSKGRNRYGVPYMGTTTAYTSQNQRVPVDILRRLPGMRGEQQNVRQQDLEAIIKIMKDTGKLPTMDHGKEYVPFINVAYNGEAWVNDGNHRIMAAAALGWKDLPVQISYFDGGERIKSGAMYPGRIGLGGIEENFADSVEQKLNEVDASAVQFRTASTDNYQNSFTVTAIADGKTVGHFSFFRDPETDDVHNQAEVTDDVRGKGYGKALLLKAIEVANDHGLGFQEDSQSLSRAQSRVYDSLYDAGWIVDADGYWFLTPEGEQELARLGTVQQGVAEARTNPDKNLKRWAGKLDLTAFAEDIRDKENWGVSMTVEPKLGINPRVGISEDTPKGIYFYPLEYFIHMVSRYASLPWGDNMPYMQLFQYDRSGQMTRQTEVDPARLRQALSQYCPEEVIQQVIDEPDSLYDGTPYWTIYDALSRLGKSDETNIVRWNKVLRDLGFTSVFDPGAGWIATGEPTQGVILDPRIIKQHKMFVNRNPTILHRKYDINRLADAINWSDYYNSESQRQQVRYGNPDRQKTMLAVANSMLRPFLGKTREEAKEMGLDQALKAAADKVIEILKQSAVQENFADGKNPGRKGLSKRVGVNTKASVSSLRKTAKNSSGEKQRMAHWLANMKAGRAKAKRK